MERYPNISDHGLVGDLPTAALVTTDGTVDWFCTPRFDSPSVFASLLDAGKGGYCRVSPDTASPSASPDGLQGSEGTFSLCTFWYVDALALINAAINLDYQLDHGAGDVEPILARTGGAVPTVMPG